MKENPSNTIAFGIVKAVFLLVFTAGMLWLVYRLYPVIVFLIIAFLVVVLGDPLMRFLQKKLKLGPTLSTVFVLTLFSVIFFGMFLLFIPLVLEQARNLSILNTGEFQQKISASIDTINNYLLAHNIHLLESFSLADLIKEINLKIIPEMVESIVGMVSNISIGYLSVMFIAYFMFKERSVFSGFVFKLIPEDDQEKYKRVIGSIKEMIIGFLYGMIVRIFILFVAYFISLQWIGVKNSLIIAFIGALFNIIPYLGPLIAVIIMVVLSFTSELTTGDLHSAIEMSIYIVIANMLIQILDNFVLQPRIFSWSVKSHPLEIFLVILASGYLFGIVGMIIAVPAYTILKILVSEFYREYKALFFKW